MKYWKNLVVCKRTVILILVLGKEKYPTNKTPTNECTVIEKIVNRARRKLLLGNDSVWQHFLPLCASRHGMDCSKWPTHIEQIGKWPYCIWTQKNLDF